MMRASHKNTKTTAWNNQILRFFNGEMSKYEHIRFVQLLNRNPHLWAKYVDFLEKLEDDSDFLQSPTDDTTEFLERWVKTNRSDTAKNKTKQANTVNKEQ